MEFELLTKEESREFSIMSTAVLEFLKHHYPRPVDAKNLLVICLSKLLINNTKDGRLETAVTKVTEELKAQVAFIQSQMETKQ